MPDRSISSGFGAGPDTAANAARQELDYQTLRGGPPSNVGRLPLANTAKCATCHQPLGPGTHTLALGQEFHTHCFVCLSCRQPPGDQFVVRDGKPLCKPCYGNELKAKATATVGGGGSARTQVTIPGVMAGRPTCAKCKQPIFTAVVSLDGGEVRCTDCFVCDKVCRLSLCVCVGG
ncbi:hypothetical protein BCR44DRAFT_277786 [Catenaria anguillulae PL171]|uniref:LIM zinc-binding domain-containing protein n=1 Tax=Catenaria anguillulae PL171 TaxID=765915 RepID=A0A1Y2HTE7_9FUNG|nr:hypothetical protein BCR44DRAFT_277786 [Catenaria anguillulae PL171]